MIYFFYTFLVICALLALYVIALVVGVIAMFTVALCYKWKYKCDFIEVISIVMRKFE